MGDSFSGSNIVAKVILVVVAIVVVLAVSFYMIVDGIKAQLVSFLDNLVETVAGKISGFLKELAHIPFKGDLKLYKIEESALEQLRTNLESSGVDTEACGLTTVRLKKMLLANAVSTSFSSTLCISTVTEEEMLENLKQKEEYKDIDSVQDFIDDPMYKKDSDELWPLNGYNYDIYFDSEKFFYFKDAEDVFTGGAGQWYLGAMGAIVLEKADNTGEMVYATADTFLQKKVSFEEAVRNPLRGEDFQEEEMLKVFTDGDSPNSIKVWTLTTEQTTYEYEFKNNHVNNGNPIEVEGEDDNYTYYIQEEEINLEDKVDISSFAISIELMVDLLNMTGSGEFLETFIDYTLGQIKADIKVYQMKDTYTTYNKEEYNINDNFIIEAYDFIDAGGTELGDLGNDNFIAYSDIVYKRIYNGSTFSGSVAKLLQTNSIDRDGEDKGSVTISAQELKNKIKESTNADLDGVLNYFEGFEGVGVTEQTILENILGAIVGYILEDDVLKGALTKVLDSTSEVLGESVGGIVEAIIGNKEFTYMSTYNVASLKQYLKTAYDPGAGFQLGDIIVTEKTTTTEEEVSYEVAVSSTKTWYVDITYSEPEKKEMYSLVKGTEETAIGEAEYTQFNSDNLEIESNSKEQVKKVRISKTLKKQYEDKYGENISTDTIVEESTYFEGGNDITSEVLKQEPGMDNKSHFENCTENGLFKIATVDGGTFNDKLGGGRGSDYLYVKYEKDIDKYKQTTKIERQYLDTSNITKEVAGTTEEKLKAFLGLLKNEDGTIPTGGTTKEFKQDGQVVLYGDIYKGHIPAGDLLLDNGALMLFELLEASEGTQGLVNIFKYLAYLYTGKDYGVSSIDQLTNFLTFSSTYCSNPLLEYIKAWENSYIKNYIDGTGSYSVAKKYITQDKTKYIIYWEESSQTWNFSYGLNLTRWWI